MSDILDIIECSIYFIFSGLSPIIASSGLVTYSEAWKAWEELETFSRIGIVLPELGGDLFIA